MTEVYLPAATAWRSSTFSGDNGGDCLEVADGVPSVVPVRDSKAPGGAVLLVEHAAWSAFVAVVKRRDLAS
ncbi:DUF397 domain-containing protein [Streptomyces spiramenti]|uniref:DUF397 domain-containing protein n=1 Tax=Streptomyces spiramenti TaxID=2720606 RepID=A0ABX1ALA0_9ACTN|nr:DUF397 domain-containing protein [Streptomyces spiramenti]NJP66604.1 DUF397 domain-containing protein [Streptomyces spiramenti]